MSSLLWLFVKYCELVYDQHTFLVHIGQFKEIRVPTLQPKYFLYAMTVYGLKNVRTELQ